MPQGVDLLLFYRIPFDMPLTNESHGAYFPVFGILTDIYFLESHDILSLPPKKRCQCSSIVTHEARQRTYIYIPARVLPDNLGLHLWQSVMGGETTVTQSTLDGRFVHIRPVRLRRRQKRHGDCFSDKGRHAEQEVE